MVLLFTLKLLSFTLSYVHAHILKDFLNRDLLNMVPTVPSVTCGKKCDFRKDYLCNALALIHVQREKVSQPLTFHSELSIAHYSLFDHGHKTALSPQG